MHGAQGEATTMNTFVKDPVLYVELGKSPLARAHTHTHTHQKALFPYLTCIPYFFSFLFLFFWPEHAAA